MQSLVANRATLIWLGLVVATCLSVELFKGLPGLNAPYVGGMAVTAIAFLKTRFILLDFMELRHAPRPMRLFAECWWIAIGAIVIATFRTNFFGL
ncbi:cytochrome C oxidase subunit IV family protein [Sphingobium sp.]|uniref:cytochrome C oxidase subunit IV family protein n=1 Tax=Sphingobium sp. TaxID=1912891 RepID=UPI0028BEB1F6|nr:cytochrome C oxidase subunit IV family protein [Sphingobium sp.]